MFAVAVVFIAFACLGDVKTTRQGRGTAMAVAVVAVVAFRIAMFAASSAVARSPGGLVVLYGLPLLTIVVCAAFIFAGARLRRALSGLTAATGRIPQLLTLRASRA
jgi:lipopolysaccharide export system permease protein